MILSCKSKKSITIWSTTKISMMNVSLKVRVMVCHIDERTRDMNGNLEGGNSFIGEGSEGGSFIGNLPLSFQA